MRWQLWKRVEVSTICPLPMQSLVAGFLASYAPTLPTQQHRAAAPNVRMQVASWYDSGARLLQSDDLMGVVAPTAAAPAAEEPTAAMLLQRYLQLNAVLPADGMSDATVEALISRAEADVAPVSFDEEKIWGEWQLVYQKNTKQATRSQKALAPLPQFSNFMIDETGRNVFRNLVAVNQRIQVVADVEYSPQADSPGTLDSTICAASVTLKLGRRFGWPPLRIPLPLRGVGFLEVSYLSEEMRITRGSRGGVFVHIRPSLLSREAAEASRVA